MTPERVIVAGLGCRCMYCGVWIKDAHEAIRTQNGHYHEACWQGDPVPYPEDQEPEWMEP